MWFRKQEQPPDEQGYGGEEATPGQDPDAPAETPAVRVNPSDEEDSSLTSNPKVMTTRTVNKGSVSRVLPKRIPCGHNQGRGDLHSARRRSSDQSRRKAGTSRALRS